MDDVPCTGPSLSNVHKLTCKGSGRNSILACHGGAFVTVAFVNARHSDLKLEYHNPPTLGWKLA
eukprot:1067268-Amphidinium_carterae.1